MNPMSSDYTISRLVLMGLVHNTAHNSVSLPGLVHPWIRSISIALVCFLLE